MKHDKLIKLILAALLAALTCVATCVIHVPIPATNGYINLGDGMVLLGAFLLGPVYGAAAGGLGSMLADLLLGYAAYAPGTLVIKGAVGLCAGLLFSALRVRTKGAALLAGVLGESVMVLGYFAYESTLLGYGLAAASSIGANCIQGLGGLLVGVPVYHALRAVPSVKKLAY